MLSRAGNYYIALFKGPRGFTKSKPMSPTIFNMVGDAVIRHWMTVADREDTGPEGLGRAVKN